MEAGDINIDADDRAKAVRTALRNDPEGFTKEYWVHAAEFRVNHPLS